MTNDYFSYTPLARGSLARSAQVNEIAQTALDGFTLLPGNQDLRSGMQVYGPESGVVNAYVVTLAKAPAAYRAGMVVRFIPGVTNTGPATVNVNGLGVATIRDASGGALAGGELASGSVVSLIHDGSRFRLQAVITAATVADGSVTYAKLDTTLKNGLILSYPTRAAAIAATIPADVDYVMAAGDIYVADATGTAMTTAGSRNWSPFGFATYEHWGAVGNNSTDDTTAIRACHNWCVLNDVPVHPKGKTYKVTARLLDYSTAVDGNGGRLTIRGAGPFQTVFNVTDDISAYLFDVSGDTDAYGNDRAQHFMFRDFSVQSDGAVDCNVFRFRVCNHVHVENVALQNCRGYGIWARQWWDSRCEVIAINCGDDGTGTGPNTANKEVINIGAQFTGGSLTASGTNNIDFGEQLHIAASRWRAMYWGPATRQCTFRGKCHGVAGSPLTIPHLVLDGAGRNHFVGASFTECDGTCIDIRNDNSYVPFRNSFTNCHIDTNSGAGIRLNGATQTIVIANIFDTPDEAVHIDSAAGSPNLFDHNINVGGGAVYLIDDYAGLADIETPGDLTLTKPGVELKMTSADGTVHTLTVTNAGVLQINGSPV